jgi:hypothetical protein
MQLLYQARKGNSRIALYSVARTRRSPPGEHLLLLFAYTAFMSRYDRPSHQVYMYFFKRGGWEVQFLESDLKTPLPPKLITWGRGPQVIPRAGPQRQVVIRRPDWPPMQ